MTLKELKKKLIEDKINPDCYSFSVNNSGDCMVLIENKKFWIIYYTERGNIYDEKKYTSEEVACNDFYEKVIRMK